MFNRRNFLAAAGAVLAAPIAAVKGWFEAPVKHLPGPDDVITFKNWTGEYDPCCRQCGWDPVQEYEIGCQQLNREPVEPIFGNLCDPCAEQQGYLCNNRAQFVRGEWWYGNPYCDCGKRGCPGLRKNWSNKVDLYKPPTIQDFQQVIDRQR